MLVLVILLMLYVLVLVATATYTLRRGGQDERFAMKAFLIAAAVSQVASLLGARWREGPEYAVLACDIGLTLALLLVVHRSRRFWPLWAAAAGLVGVLTHIVRWVSPLLSREVYASIQPFWAFPIMLAIVIGTVTHAGTDRRPRRRAGRPPPD